MENRIRVAVVDENERFVRALETLIPEVSGGRAAVVATAADVGQARRAVRDSVPEVVLLGLHLPPVGGLRALGAVREAAPRARILTVAEDEDPALVIEALRAGAAGFMRRSTDPAQLRQPLLAALDGWAVLPPHLLTALAEKSRPPSAHAASHLDDADRRLLRLIAEGASTNDIAGVLHVSDRTVKRLTASLLRKLKVSSRTEAAALAGSAGLLEPQLI
ncbi:response regulator transcription factor [Actinoplanes sp. NPDC051861]|uniref:response regulator transcription factor n=1 Tax=Actinoplanes sp. NPDC051861 TaxID=3155170 RepID=UPI003444F28D